MCKDVKPMSDEGVEHVRRVVAEAYAAGNPSPYEVQTAMLLRRIDVLKAVVDKLVDYQEDFRGKTMDLCPGNTYWSARLLLVVDAAREASGKQKLCCSQCGKTYADEPCGFFHMQIRCELEAAMKEQNHED